MWVFCSGGISVFTAASPVIGSMTSAGPGLPELTQYNSNQSSFPEKPIEKLGPRVFFPPTLTHLILASGFVWTKHQCTRCLKEKTGWLSSYIEIFISWSHQLSC